MRTIEARIEIPMGSRNKYEIDEKTGHIKLDRVLYSSVYYPAEYGYVEGTRYLDGDPLDILVFTSSPTFPGCYVDCRIVGGLNMIDCGQPDVKILAVNCGDPRYDHVRELADLPPHYLAEIQNFFRTYKTLQNKKTEVGDFFDSATAFRIIDESFDRFRAEQTNAAPPEES
ncbi:MAG: inorganic diphosphatase [Akkermansia sp.]